MTRQQIQEIAALLSAIAAAILFAVAAFLSPSFFEQEATGKATEAARPEIQHQAVLKASLGGSPLSANGASAQAASAGRPSDADLADFRALGRPSIDAIWNGRMTLASPSQWASGLNEKPADSKLELAYAPQPTARSRREDPFAVIDDGKGVKQPPGSANLATSPKAPQDAQTDEEEDDEDDDASTPSIAVPRPLPRPKNLIAAETHSDHKSEPGARPASLPQTQPDTAPPPASNQAHTGQTPEPATAPAPSPARRAIAAVDDPPGRESQNYALLEEQQREIKLASLPQNPISTAPAAPQLAPPSATKPTITLKTPFGIPYALQQENVETACFPPPLVDLIRKVGDHYGHTPIVTSGLRDRGRRGSLHRRCLAADIMIPGVSANELAKVARQIPGMGGVGQYCHPNLVHIDVGTARDWKQGCGGYFALRDGSVSRRASFTR